MATPEPQSPPARRRLRGVVLVSILLTLIGLQWLTLVVLTMLGYRLPLWAQTALGEATILRSLSGLGPAWSISFGLVGAMIFLPLAVGFWRMRRWAWVGTMIAASITITIQVLGRLFGSNDGRWTWGEAALVVTIAVVFYLNLHHVQKVFRAADPKLPPMIVIRSDAP